MDFKKPKQEYITGNISTRKLAEKYGVSYHTLRKVAVKEKWTALRDEFRQKSASKIVDIESDKQAYRMKRLLTVSDELLDVVEDAVRSFKVGDLLIDKTALKSLSSTIKDIKDIQNIKTQLDIEEQRARIANLQKQAQADERHEEIKVTIASGLEEYSK